MGINRGILHAWKTHRLLGRKGKVVFSDRASGIASVATARGSSFRRVVSTVGGSLRRGIISTVGGRSTLINTILTSGSGCCSPLAHEVECAVAHNLSQIVSHSE